MRIILVGAGPVGEYLLGLTLEAGHEAVMIEEDEERAEHCAQTYDCLVLNAAIGEEDILEEAGAKRADALIATTVDDSANLMAMVLGAEYDIDNLTSTVNAKHHKPLFERLGVRTLVDPEILVAQHLLDLVLNPKAEDVTTLTDSGQIYELVLAPDSALAGLSFGELDEEQALPKDTFIVSIQRDEERFFPRESSRLQGGDCLLVYARQRLDESDLSLFTGDTG